MRAALAPTRRSSLPIVSPCTSGFAITQSSPCVKLLKFDWAAWALSQRAFRLGAEQTHSSILLPSSCTIRPAVLPRIHQFLSVSIPVPKFPRPPDSPKLIPDADDPELPMLLRIQLTFGQKDQDLKKLIASAQPTYLSSSTAYHRS
jgi:hypothetical protein